jgi:hypothetical protein
MKRVAWKVVKLKDVPGPDHDSSGAHPALGSCRTSKNYCRLGVVRTYSYTSRPVDIGPPVRFPTVYLDQY